MTGSGQAGHPSERQTSRFLILYALAWAGGAIAYIPLLTLLLPLRLTALTGAADVQWLAYATFAGAVTASLANIGFGWLSDISGNRRRFVAAGLLLTLLSYLPISRLTDPLALLLALVGWQISLNMMLGPLAAWAADTVPDAQKGLLGGLIAFAPATGALAGALVTIPGLADPAMRIGMVAALVLAFVLPLLLFGRPTRVSALHPPMPAPASRPAHGRRTLAIMWISRLAIQTAEAVLFAYLLFLFRAVDPAFRDADVARVFSLVLLASVPVALLTGRWADRQGRPIMPLVVFAGLSAAGLAGMAAGSGTAPVLAGYILFGFGSTVFLALHSGQTMRVLPRPHRHGRDLGFFNLANTFPSLLVPLLAIGIVPAFGFVPLIWVLAGLSLLACLLLASLPALTTPLAKERP